MTDTFQGLIFGICFAASVFGAAFWLDSRRPEPKAEPQPLKTTKQPDLMFVKPDGEVFIRCPDGTDFRVCMPKDWMKK